MKKWEVGNVKERKIKKWLVIGIVWILIGVVYVAVPVNVSAASYSDADGDGFNEVGETITFVGDDSYIDKYGVEHPFVEWYWDFESDGIIDAYPDQIVTHTYDKVGTYKVTIYAIDDINIIIEFRIEIVLPIHEEPTIEDIIEDIEEMELPEGIDDSCESILENAIDSLGNNQDIAAANKLEAFINLVEALKGKKFSDEEADALIGAAQWIIDSLS